MPHEADSLGDTNDQLLTFDKPQPPTLGPSVGGCSSSSKSFADLEHKSKDITRVPKCILNQNLLAATAKEINITEELGKSLVDPKQEKMLCAFSGPEREGSLKQKLLAKSFGCDNFDIVVSKEHDLLDDHKHKQILQDIEGDVYAGGMLSPPCDSFSGARRNDEGDIQGPGPLRDETGPGRYGKPGITPEEKERVKIGTLLALRARDYLLAFKRKGLPVILEQPKVADGRPSMMKLDEFAEILKDENCKTTEIVQCEMGAITTKPTFLMGFNVCFDRFPTKCTHTSKWWRKPWSGAWRFAPHPQLRGTQWEIPGPNWHEGMLRNKEPPGEFITKQASAYPEEMNENIALSLIDGQKLKNPTHPTTSQQPQDFTYSTHQKISMPHRLRLNEVFS